MGVVYDRVKLVNHCGFNDQYNDGVVTYIVLTTPLTLLSPVHCVRWRDRAVILANQKANICGSF